MVLVQVATVMAIVMALWYQPSPNQYYWYSALHASRLLVLCVGAEVRVPCRLARDGNQSRTAFEGDSHLVGMVVGLEALS